MYKQLYYVILTLYSKLITLVAPYYCTYCRQFLSVHQVLCSSCTTLIKPIVSVNLKVTPKYTITVHSVSGYQEPLQSLILAKKKSHYRASKQLAELMWKHSVLECLEFDYLIPVPLHWTRYMFRGYNQATVIAQELSRLSGKPILSCLKRVHRTPYQASLSALERKTNVHEAFKLNIQDTQTYADKVFVLVDDLMTTGSTLQATGKVLTQLKPKALYAIVPCRVVS